MKSIVFSFLLGLIVILMSALPISVHADGRKGRDARQEAVSNRARNVERKEVGRTRRIDRELRNRTSDRYRDNTAKNYVRYGAYQTYGYPLYSSYYGIYDYNYPSYSYAYPNTYLYPEYDLNYYNPGYYNPGYYNPGMYNPNTTFVNPPSSLNYPYVYPDYSETYIYR